MGRMFALLLLFGPLHPDIEEIDVLARGRDARGLMAHAGPNLTESSFDFIRLNGAFGTGSKGWRAFELTDPTGGATYVVFGTALTTQDYGEFVFETEGGKLTRLQDERETRGWKVLHYGFKMDFDVPQKRANITATVRLRRAPDAKPAAHLRLSPHYKVTRVVDAQGNAVPYAQASGVVSVVPPPGQETSITMSYSGIVNQPRFAGSIVADEVMLTNDYWWPSIARGPATASTTATIPADWILVTNGKKTSDTVNGQARTTTFQMDVPVSYLSLSAGKFQHEQKKVGRITYHVWSNDMSQADMREQLDLMPDVIEFYDRFATYPFDDWGAVVSEIYGGGALEAYSYATYGTGWLPDEDSHEPAHTWFGGLLSNTYLNSYWNESFANYCGGLFERERAVGDNEERRHAFVSTADLQRSFSQAPIEGTGAFKGGLASALGYGKGALVLQQLEREIGTEKMVAAMQTWLKDNPKGEAAEWAGFEKAVNKATGQDLKWFFDQWVRQATPPQFEITEVGYVKNEVRGRVDFRGVPHRITTEVFAELVDGTTTHFDVVLNPDRKTGVSEFSFKLSKKPKLLSFDPYDRILRERSPSTSPKLRTKLRSLTPVLDASHREYASTFEGLANTARAVEAVPSDPNGCFFIGHPSSMPVMRDLCRRAGFTVQGDTLTYDSTKINLKSGAAVAIVDLGNGRTCAIGLGVTLRRPDVGSASLCVVDGRGRFLRGRTEPRREGSTVFRIP